MANDRVIKTDGDLDITATDTSVSGTFTVSGQSTLSGLSYPTADGTADQVLTTNGSGALSFATLSGGFDEITSNSEAGNYSGTARIIYITASEAVTFTSALSDRIIINKNDYLVKFRANVTNCTIQTDNDLELDNFASGSFKFENCKINCKTLTLDAEEDDTPSTSVSIENCDVYCEGNLEMTQITNGVTEYSISKSNIYCGGDFIVGTSNNVSDNVDISYCNINVSRLRGQIHIPTGGPSTFRAREGSAGQAKLTIQAVQYMSGNYAYPFVADYEGVDTRIIAQGNRSLSQNITASTATTLAGFTETVDNTSSFNATTGVFTAPVKGDYLVSAYLIVSSLSSDASVSAIIHAAGSDAAFAQNGLDIQDKTSVAIPIPGYVASINAGQTIELRTFTQTDSNYNVQTSHFAIQKIN